MNTFFLDRLNSEPHALAFAGQSTPWPVALADQSANPALDEALHTHAAAAQALRDQKDQADKLLDILEQELRALLHEKTLDSSKKTDDFPPHWRGATPSGICTILEAVLRARRQRAANVSWAALSEGLMQTISEEIQTWQV